MLTNMLRFSVDLDLMCLCKAMCRSEHLLEVYQSMKVPSIRAALEVIPVPSQGLHALHSVAVLARWHLVQQNLLQCTPVAASRPSSVLPGKPRQQSGPHLPDKERPSQHFPDPPPFYAVCAACSEDIPFFID